jgi:hypothetical protein
MPSSGITDQQHEPVMAPSPAPASYLHLPQACFAHLTTALTSCIWSRQLFCCLPFSDGRNPACVFVPLLTQEPDAGALDNPEDPEFQVSSQPL